MFFDQSDQQMQSGQGEAPAEQPLREFLAESPDYYAGFTSVTREMERAQARGYAPTERQLVLAITHAARIYTTARGGKPIAGRSPDWLRGRVDGLRSLVRRGLAAKPAADEAD